jgi:hypothetical protein
MATVRANTTDERIAKLAHEIAYGSCDPEGDVANLLTELREARRELADAKRS